jgi:hypothetical protein
MREIARRNYRANPGRSRDNQRRYYERNPLYTTWQSMMARCYNPGHQAYHNYGGRGIGVWGPWHDHARFAADIVRDLGPRPEGMTLDRAGNDGDYEPGNLRWATPAEQRANQRA